MQEYHKYVYEGPVMEFDHIVDNKWHGETMAPSEVKAKCNLAYQYKKEHNRTARARIALPGKVTVIN